MLSFAILEVVRRSQMKTHTVVCFYLFLVNTRGRSEVVNCTILCYQTPFCSSDEQEAYNNNIGQVRPKIKHSSTFSMLATMPNCLSNSVTIWGFRTRNTLGSFTSIEEAIIFRVLQSHMSVCEETSAYEQDAKLRSCFR